MRRSHLPQSRSPSLTFECLESRDLLAVMPIGAEFRVNTYTFGNQFNAKVAMDSQGNFVATWHSEQDGNIYGVMAQRFSAAGQPLGDEFNVNTYTSGFQWNPNVAMDDDGDFVIVWQGKGLGDETGIFGQRFGASGLRRGNEFRINNTTWEEQSRPAVAMDADGDFVVTWNSMAEDGTGWNIHAKLYSSVGAAQGTAFQVNTTNYHGSQLSPTVDRDRIGNFVIAWQSDFGTFARRFNVIGTPLGTEFQVHSGAEDSYNFDPAVALSANGEFVIAWQAMARNLSASNIFAKRYDAAGIAQGTEFRVDSPNSGGLESNVAVAMSSLGDFVVTWNSRREENSLGIYAQRYASSGQTLGSEIHVNSYSSDTQKLPAVAMDSDGDFVVTWVSNHQDGHKYGVYAQRYKRFPSADAAGPYSLNEGDTLALSAISDPEYGAPLSFSWDIDADGLFGDAFGSAITLTWAQLMMMGIADGSNQYDLRVQIAYADGITASSEVASLTVGNRPPFIHMDGSHESIRGQVQSFVLHPTDHSPLDQAANFTYDIDWNNDGIVDHSSVSSGGGLTVSHVFTQSGTHTIRATITDKDGGVSDPVLFQVTVVDWALLQDPNDNAKTDLHWGGTTGIDAYAFVPGLVLKQAENNRLFGTPQITFLPSFNGKIYVYGQGGNDLVFADIVNVPLIVSGGDGDDVLIGGRAGDTIDGGNGNDILFGGTLDTDGNDLLSGGDGNDLIIGHLGADSLHGGAGSDLLIAGKLQFSNLPTAIYSVQSEWLSGRPLATKVQNLSGIGTGPRNNGDWFVQAGSTALDDGAIDEILGEADDDWLLYDFSEDLASDLNLAVDAATNVT